MAMVQFNLGIVHDYGDYLGKWFKSLAFTSFV